MLHEILLSLSGQPSPLLNVHSDQDAIPQDSFPLLSPPEKALLTSLAHLSRLHARLRTHTSIISSSHASVICRAVSTAITAEHLSRFQKKVLEVEKAILVEDSGYVGGYGIVPLSTIVGEFGPWTRRLEWLWETVRFIQPEHRTKSSSGRCTGAALIDHLRAESQTGYSDLEEMALQLVTAAETAWMRQLSMWLLYGNLPMFGKDDFFIQEDTASEQGRSQGVTQFNMHANLLPKFVSPQTASSILFIGKSLNHIRAKGNPAVAGDSSHLLTTPVTLHGEHIEHLASLKSPISTSKLSSAINAIRLSLSQSTLAKLLPLPKILEILSLLHDFLLLRRGEFAMALVSHADARVNDRHRRTGPAAARGKAPESLEGLSIKEGDAMAALTQAFAELYSLQNEEDPIDDELDLARDLVHLSINDNRSGCTVTPSQDMVGADIVAEMSNVSFDDLLFPTATLLSVQVRPPLDLFLSASDISIYSKIHSYLLGIRRAQIRLGDLWKHTFIRRSHPSPWGPPRSNTPFGLNRLKMGRQRDSARSRQMRPIWATSSASLFVLSEIGSFFQGEVVNGSWQHLRDWIEGRSPTGPKADSRPGTASSSKQKHDASVISETTSAPNSHQPHDPETLTVAHRRYLSSLVQSLFLTDAPFTSALRSLLACVDRFVALVIRLESIQRNMDLETDEGVVDALADYPREEIGVWQELRATRGSVEAGIKDVVARLRDIDDNRSGEGRRMLGVSKNPSQNWPGTHRNGSEPDIDHYVPRNAAGVDRLLMKLDFGNLNDSAGLGTGDAGGFVEMD